MAKSPAENVGEISLLIVFMLLAMRTVLKRSEDKDNFIKYHKTQRFAKLSPMNTKDNNLANLRYHIYSKYLNLSKNWFLGNNIKKNYGCIVVDRGQIADVRKLTKNARVRQKIDTSPMYILLSKLTSDTLKRGSLQLTCPEALQENNGVK